MLKFERTYGEPTELTTEIEITHTQDQKLLRLTDRKLINFWGAGRFKRTDMPSAFWSNRDRWCTENFGIQACQAGKGAICIWTDL